MTFIEIEPDCFVNSDQIVSVEMKVAQYNPKGTPFKYEILVKLIDGREFVSPMKHKADLLVNFNDIIDKLNGL